MNIRETPLSPEQQKLMILRSLAERPFKEPTEEELEKIKLHASVDGHLSDRESLTLFREAQLANPGKLLTAVELGSWLGKSGYLIARAVQEKGGGRLYCVDPFDLSAMSEDSVKQNEQILSRSIRELFQENIVRTGVDNVITVIEGKSQDVVDDFKEEIDFLFIDASHEYNDVMCDFEKWSKNIKPGGIIAFDDVDLSDSPHHDGPRRVVMEKIMNSNDWELLTSVDGYFSARKKITNN